MYAENNLTKVSYYFCDSSLVVSSRFLPSKRNRLCIKAKPVDHVFYYEQRSPFLGSPEEEQVQIVSPPGAAIGTWQYLLEEI